eukprot:393968-Pelagomonas_calceolata.AAC.3
MALHVMAKPAPLEAGCKCPMKACCNFNQAAGADVTDDAVSNCHAVLTMLIVALSCCAARSGGAAGNDPLQVASRGAAHLPLCAMFDLPEKKVYRCVRAPARLLQTVTAKHALHFCKR